MNRIELSSFIKIPMNEQESVLRWEAGEREFCFYTSDKNEIKKILRMMDEHPDDISVKHADKYGIEVIIPRRWLHVRQPRKGRSLTDEQKELMRLGRELADMGRNA